MLQQLEQRGHAQAAVEVLVKQHLGHRTSQGREGFHRRDRSAAPEIAERAAALS
jgi:hypothetical protein